MQHGSDRASGKSAFVSPKPTRAASRRPLLVVTLDNFVPIARPSRRRRIFQVSALSTFDGTCYAYHGDNG